jgi:hypothetical protein
MRKSLVKYIAAAAFLALGGLATIGGAQAPSGLEGAWQVIEVTNPLSTNTKPQPGLYLFTKHHYSIVEDIGAAERPEIPNGGANSTAAEILAAYGASFRSQAGTYEAADGRITLGTMVSKNPTAMRRGTPTQGTYTMANGVLTLTTGNMVRKLKRIE